MKINGWFPWGARLEKALIKLVVATAALALIAQALLAGDAFRQAAVPAATGEAVRPHLKNSSGILERPVVTLRLKNYSSLPHARVLVNGEPRGEFRERYVTVFVQEGDVLEIDGTRYNRPLDIEVLDVSREVVLPAAGSSLRVEGSVATLGRVCLGEGKI